MKNSFALTVATVLAGIAAGTGTASAATAQLEICNQATNYSASAIFPTQGNWATRLVPPGGDCVKFPMTISGETHFYFRLTKVNGGGLYKKYESATFFVTPDTRTRVTLQRSFETPTAGVLKVPCDHSDKC